MNTPETNQKVSLGCGTLILIAIIVLIFGGISNDSLIFTQIKEMKTELQRMSAEIQRLGTEIKGLRAALDKTPR